MKLSALRSLGFTLSATLVLSGAAFADTSASSFLVARQADRANDFEIAADYYQDALFFDPTNIALARGAVDALMALGDFESAAEISEQLIASGEEEAGIYLAVLGNAAIDEDYARIVALLDSTELATNELTDLIVSGWAKLGLGDVAGGLSEFETVVSDDRFQAIGFVHLGMAKAFVGDLEGALNVFQQAAERNIQSPRSILAEAQILAALDRTTEALRLLREAFGASSETVELISQIEAGETVQFSMIETPADGIAEIFYTIADALNEDNPNLFNLYYARLAQDIRPFDSDAALLVADMLEQLGRHRLAREVYLDIEEDEPAFFTAAMGVAETLRAEGQVEEAAAHLQGVIADIGAGPYILVTLGDIYRQLDRYDDAAKAYSERLNLGIQNGYQDWYVYYVRGISYERLKQWESAEADFRKSLELQPAHPQVLNYLGYSLVERREKLDEALAMIEQAVALRPDSGYIVDSLGWVFYRLGRFDEAVVPMELAVELLATDPIVNDHLGDVYWKVGREYEARFQWQRALSFGPVPEEAERIRRKLEVGLDVVLEEETSND